MDKTELNNNNDLITKYDLNNLKTDINEFLFSKVPGDMTIAEFEGLAMAVHNKIFETLNKWV